MYHINEPLSSSIKKRAKENFFKTKFPDGYYDRFYTITTFINNANTTLSLLKLLGLIKFSL